MLKNVLKVLFLLFLFCNFLYAEDDDLSLDYTDAPVSRILDTIAMLADKNLILDQAIDSSMSLHVKHMNSQQVLNLVLTAQHLNLSELGNTWVITTHENLLSALKTQNAVSAAQNQNEVLQTELFSLHYANGQGILSLIQQDKALMSARGQIAWDSRTNTLVATDTASALQNIRTLIEGLDIPVTQVRIGARLVVIDKSALQAFGVELDSGATSAMNILGSVNKMSLNLGIANPAGTIGFRLGKIAGNELDLELQALETSGEGKIVSAPELTVSDHQTAEIEQGSEVPFQTSTASGATQIQFIPATLGLKVTPELAGHGELNLILKVNKNSVSSEIGPAGNVPIINTSEVMTQVLMQSGETIVLGGIYSESHEHSVKQVPLLGGIPGLGWLFKNDQENSKYTDLLIFITPTILDPT